MRQHGGRDRYSAISSCSPALLPQGEPGSKSICQSAAERLTTKKGKADLNGYFALFFFVDLFFTSAFPLCRWKAEFLRCHIPWCK